METTVRIKEEK
jgi:MFS family permease